MARYDVTAIGSKLTLISALFPAGFVISEGSDDVPLWDVSCTPFGETSVGLNCDQIDNKSPSVYTITVGVIPNSRSDRNLKKMVAMNRAQGTNVTVDIIQGILVEPSGDKQMFPNLNMVEGALTNTPNSNGRFQTRTYTFKGVNQIF